MGIWETISSSINGSNGAVKDGLVLAHQYRAIAIASELFRVDGTKPPKFSQEEWVLGSEIVTQTRKSLVIFHGSLTSQCSIGLSCLRNHKPRWALQSQIETIAANPPPPAPSGMLSPLFG